MKMQFKKKIILAAEKSVRRTITTTKDEKVSVILKIHRAGIKHYNQIVFAIT